MDTILRYIGMKDINLIDIINNKYSVYCEPFGGSFNTGFKLFNQGYKGEIIYNDIDEKLINFWKCMKNNSEKLYKMYCSLNDNIIICRDKESKNNMLKEWYSSQDKYKRAVAEFVYRQNLTMKGLSWTNKGTKYDIFDFYLIEYALSNINIYNFEYADIFRKYDSTETFFLIDPPYDIKSVSLYYRGNSKEFNHEELAELIKTLKSGWLLTYNDNDRIRKLYSNYNIKEMQRKICGKMYTELYITNIEGLEYGKLHT